MKYVTRITRFRSGQKMVRGQNFRMLRRLKTLHLKSLVRQPNQGNHAEDGQPGEKPKALPACFSAPNRIGVASLRDIIVGRRDDDARGGRFNRNQRA